MELELAHNSYQFFLYSSEIGHIDYLLDFRQGKHRILIVIEISLDIKLVGCSSHGNIGKEKP